MQTMTSHLPNVNSKPEASKRPWWAFPAAFVLCLTPIFLVGGFSSGFTYWNAAPVAMAFALLAAFGDNRFTGTFAVVAIGFTELMHIAWIGDLGDTATGSSTSGLIFIFLPFWSVLFGLIAVFVAWIISRFAPRTAPRSASQQRRHLE